MASSSYDEPRQFGTPGQLIIDGHTQMTGAQLQFVSAKSTGVRVEQAREQFHDAVLSFFKLLQYKLETVDSVSKFWEDEPVMQWVPVRYSVDGDGKPANEIERGRPVDSPRSDQYLRDGEGGVILLRYEPHRTGLQHLQSWIGATEVQQTAVSDAFGNRVDRDETYRLLPEHLLFDCALALEKAADRLGLLARTDDSVPRTEITEDMIEEIEAWEQAHKK